MVEVVLICDGEGRTILHLRDQGLEISAGYSVYSCACTEETPTWTLAGQSVAKRGEATEFADEYASAILSSPSKMMVHYWMLLENTEDYL